MYTYDPYWNLASSTGNVTNPFQYAGQYTDSESGLQDLRTRYYDPTTQQFLTVDPLVGATGEPYAYTADNPINGIDPYGLWCVGRVCSDQVGHVLGQIGNHAGTIAPVAIYGAVLTGAVVCAYFTLGICVAADVATGGLLFAGGTFLASSVLPFGEGLASTEGACSGLTIAGTEGLEHSFGRHASEWFGREVSAGTDMEKWEAIVTRAASSTQVFSWSLRGRRTVAHLARIPDGAGGVKWFVVQFYAAGDKAGQLATAFIPDQD